MNKIKNINREKNGVFESGLKIGGKVFIRPFINSTISKSELNITDRNGLSGSYKLSELGETYKNVIDIVINSNDGSSGGSASGATNDYIENTQILTGVAYDADGTTRKGLFYRGRWKVTDLTTDPISKDMTNPITVPDTTQFVMTKCSFVFWDSANEVYSPLPSSAIVVSFAWQYNGGTGVNSLKCTVFGHLASGHTSAVHLDIEYIILDEPIIN